MTKINSPQKVIDAIRTINGSIPSGAVVVLAVVSAPRRANGVLVVKTSDLRDFPQEAVDKVVGKMRSAQADDTVAVVQFGVGNEVHDVALALTTAGFKVMQHFNAPNPEPLNPEVDGVA